MYAGNKTRHYTFFTSHNPSLSPTTKATGGLLHHLVDHIFVSLSDGKQRKVMIANVLAQDTPIIFMDETAAFLDYPSKIELVNIMHKLSREKRKTILFSSHDLDLLLRHCDRLWVMAPH